MFALKMTRCTTFISILRLLDVLIIVGPRQQTTSLTKHDHLPGASRGSFPPLEKASARQSEAQGIVVACNGLKTSVHKDKPDQHQPGWTDHCRVHLTKNRKKQQAALPRDQATFHNQTLTSPRKDTVKSMNNIKIQVGRRFLVEAGAIQFPRGLSTHQRVLAVELMASHSIPLCACHLLFCSVGSAGSC